MIRDEGDVPEVEEVGKVVEVGEPEAVGEPVAGGEPDGVVEAADITEAEDVAGGADTIVTASRNATRILLMSALSRYLVKEKPLTRTSPPNTRYTSWRPVAPLIAAVRSR
ncbi:hypothetical protein GCM10023085_02560 [Actinomadura viridis]